MSPETLARIDTLRTEGSETLVRGQFDRARRDFEEILKLSPGDPSAQRDAARAGQAAGEFEYSAEALERAHHFEQHHRDPELHYLRGEALFVLGRVPEARLEHRIAELEIGDKPSQRMERLWLARIYARRGYVVLADRIYEPMWPPAPGVDSEVALNQADAYLMNESWEGVARVLRRYLERDPKSIRGREMLAWALEAKGDLDGELQVRQSLAADMPSTLNYRDYGRALERAADFAGARDQYDGALQVGRANPEASLVASLERMRLRTTPEVGGGFSARSDPQASSLRVLAGVARPFGSRQCLSLQAWWDTSRGGFPSGQGTVTGIGSSLLLAARGGSSLVLGGDVRYSSASVSSNGVVFSDRQMWTVGAQGEADSQLASFVQINVHGDLNEQWSESPVTIQEGGTTTGVTGHLFLFPPDRRVLLDAGVQRRRLTLAGRDEDRSPRSTQTLLFVGGDVILWNSPTRLLRGEVLDERLVRRVYLNDAGILSYRHYQLFTDADPDFAARIALAPRAAIHNLSLVIRKVFADGRAGIDLRGGGGYDTERRRTLTQVGVSVVIAPTWSSRISISYDMARETATGLSGTLHTGWVTYHADL